jgi:hypothetical protein
MTSLQPVTASRPCFCSVARYTINMFEFEFPTGACVSDPGAASGRKEIQFEFSAAEITHSAQHAPFQTYMRRV